MAAMLLDIEYVGIDCNPDLEKPVQDMLKCYQDCHDATVKYLIGKCENSVPELQSYEFDFVFSSLSSRFLFAGPTAVFSERCVPNS